MQEPVIYSAVELLAMEEEHAREILAKARLMGLDLAPVITQCGTWAVTEYGVECLTQEYSISKDRLWQGDGLSGWEYHMAGKKWVEMDDFLEAFYVARRYFPIPQPKGA